MYSLVALSILPFLLSVDAAIGPLADLHIANKNIAPDGFTRSCVNGLMMMWTLPYSSYV
jgi:iron transport multicopper oxidase